MAPGKGQAVDAQASEWLARLQREDLSLDERAEFERWLDLEPAHAVAFTRAEYAWERAARLQATPRFGFRAASTRRAHYWAAAAILALAAVGTLFHATRPDDVYATTVGEHRSLTLTDGSRVELNTASRLDVEMDGERRFVRLVRGEALFKVARDPARPFIVQAGDTAVRALGTEFNVRVREQLVEVAVSEGLVAVDDVRLAAGASMIVAPGAVNHRVSVDEEDVRRRVSWRYGVIELKGETLAQAVEEFNRYRTRKLVVADPEIAGIRIGGRFETDEADKFLGALASSFHVRAVESEDGQTYLFGQP